MDSIQNLRAFTRSASLGSFAAAAREIRTAPSVIMKRVGQLEHQFGVTLFHRSTRKLTLTEEGARLLPRCLRLAADFDDLTEARFGAGGMRGRLQVGAAGPASARLFTPIFCEFMAANPHIELNVLWTEQLSNPLEDGLDIAIGTRTVSYSDVLDVPLAPYPRLLCASPGYLALRGMPEHPRELAGHDCILSPKSGTTWRFNSDAGEIAVEVRPRFTVNSSISVREAVRHDLGVAILPNFLVKDDLEAGRLIHLFEDHDPIGLWMKALVPKSKAEIGSVKAFLLFVQQRLQTVLPADAD
jgi:DNA-binding transcriptional LysR family regulator